MEIAICWRRIYHPRVNLLPEQALRSVQSSFANVNIVKAMLAQLCAVAVVMHS
jgi:hypothetical protein